jgi:hypothetical protein
MTTLFSSRGATGVRTRWLVLTQCEDAGPEADPSPPPPHRTAPHRPHALPTPAHAPRALPRPPPPRSHVLCPHLSPALAP